MLLGAPGVARTCNVNWPASKRSRKAELLVSLAGGIAISSTEAPRTLPRNCSNPGSSGNSGAQALKYVAGGTETDNNRPLPISMASQPTIARPACHRAARRPGRTNARQRLARVIPSQPPIELLTKSLRLACRPMITVYWRDSTAAVVNTTVDRATNREIPVSPNPMPRGTKRMMLSRKSCPPLKLLHRRPGCGGSGRRPSSPRALIHRAGP